MKTLAIAAVLASVFTASSAFALEPIEGSITYGGQPATRLTAAPVNSPVNHTFTDKQGRQVRETYLVSADRTLKLVDRNYSEN